MSGCYFEWRRKIWRVSPVMGGGSNKDVDTRVAAAVARARDTSKRPNEAACVGVACGALKAELCSFAMHSSKVTND